MLHRCGAPRLLLLPYVYQHRHQRGKMWKVEDGDGSSVGIIVKAAELASSRYLTSPRNTLYGKRSGPGSPTATRGHPAAAARRRLPVAVATATGDRDALSPAPCPLGTVTPSSLIEQLSAAPLATSGRASGSTSSSLSFSPSSFVNDATTADPHANISMTSVRHIASSSSSTDPPLQVWFHAPPHIKLRKDKRLYRQECAAFRQAHPHTSSWPSAAEVSPDVKVELAPVAALQAWQHSPLSTQRLVEDALLLQQNIRQHQLLQAGETSTWMRCLRCFHVHHLKPRRLLLASDTTSGSSGNGIHLSWEAKAEATKKQAQRQPVTKRHRQAAIRRTRQALKEMPESCPQCGSRRVQWFLDYVHMKTHVAHQPS